MPPVQAARKVTGEDAGATELAVVMEPETDATERGSPGGKSARRPSEAGDGAAVAAQALGEEAALGGEEVPTHGSDQERKARAARRVNEAAAELERREEADVQAADARPEVPGIAGMALELLIGGMRLARAMVTAPLRLGLALLHRSA